MVRHLSLLQLLKGLQPAGLLAAPLPPAYVSTRVRNLARGTCLEAFRWNGGGEWPAGVAWTQELPDDSSLLLYLVAAFLQAPGWTWLPSHAGLAPRPAAPAAPASPFGPGPAPLWPAPGGPGGSPHHATGHGVPLFVGALPAAARAPERYACLLLAPHRPPEGASGAFGLSIPRSGPPLAHCYALGRELCVSAGYQGVLHALVLFFLVAQTRGGGALGQARLDSALVALSSIFTEPGGRL